MITQDAAEWAAALPPGAPVLGLDLGTKTIGVAISDLRLSIATPLETIRRRKFGLDAAALSEIIQQRQAVALVLGLPFNMDGSEGPRAQSTRAFSRNFQALHPLPLLLWDERLSTVAAERALLDADVSRARRAQVIDHVAAGVILQGALDRLHHLRANA